MVVDFVLQPYYTQKEIHCCFKGLTWATPTEEVKNMKKNNWISNANKVRAWAENQDPSDNLSAVMLSLQLGDNAANDDLRSTYWTAIRSIGSTMDGFPQARRGRESNLSETQELVLATVEESVAYAFAQIPTEFHELLLTVIVPHGRTGGVYGSFDELCASFKKQAHNYIIQSMKDGRVAMTKDGEFDMKGDLLQITPRTKPEKAESKGGSEEEWLQQVSPLLPPLAFGLLGFAITFTKSQTIW